MKASKSFSGIGSSLLMAFVMSICFITVAFGQVNNLPDANSTPAGDAESATAESINIGPPVVFPAGNLSVTPERIDKVYYIASGSNEAVIAPTHDDSAVLDLRNTGPGSLNWYATYSPFFAVDPDEGHLCDFGAEVITVSWDIPSPPGCSGIILFESNKGACTVEIHLEVIEMDDSSDPSESQIGPQNRRKQ